MRKAMSAGDGSACETSGELPGRAFRISQQRILAERITLSAGILLLCVPAAHRRGNVCYNSKSGIGFHREEINANIFAEKGTEIFKTT